MKNLTLSLSPEAAALLERVVGETILYWNTDTNPPPFMDAREENLMRTEVLNPLLHSIGINNGAKKKTGLDIRLRD